MQSGRRMMASAGPTSEKYCNSVPAFVRFTEVFFKMPNLLTGRLPSR
jgi:hypothetical protein